MLDLLSEAGAAETPHLGGGHRARTSESRAGGSRPPSVYGSFPLGGSRPPSTKANSQAGGRWPKKIGRFISWRPIRTAGSPARLIGLVALLYVSGGALLRGCDESAAPGALFSSAG